MMEWPEVDVFKRQDVFCSALVTRFMKKLHKYQNLMLKHKVNITDSGYGSSIHTSKSFDDDIELVLKEDSSTVASCKSFWTLGARVSVLKLFQWVCRIVQRTKAARILCHIDAVPEREIEATITEVATELSVAFEYHIVMLYSDEEVVKLADHAVSCLTTYLNSCDSVFCCSQLLRAVTEVKPLTGNKKEIARTRAVKYNGKSFCLCWKLWQIFKQPGLRVLDDKLDSDIHVSPKTQVGTNNDLDNRCSNENQQICEARLEAQINKDTVCASQNVDMPEIHLEKEIVVDLAYKNQENDRSGSPLGTRNISNSLRSSQKGNIDNMDTEVPGKVLDVELETKAANAKGALLDNILFDEQKLLSMGADKALFDSHVTISDTKNDLEKNDRNIITVADLISEKSFIKETDNSERTEADRKFIDISKDINDKQNAFSEDFLESGHGKQWTEKVPDKIIANIVCETTETKNITVSKEIIDFAKETEGDFNILDCEDSFNGIKDTQEPLSVFVGANESNSVVDDEIPNILNDKANTLETTAIVECLSEIHEKLQTEEAEVDILTQSTEKERDLDHENVLKSNDVDGNKLVLLQNSSKTEMLKPEQLENNQYTPHNSVREATEIYNHDQTASHFGDSVNFDIDNFRIQGHSFPNAAESINTFGEVNRKSYYAASQQNELHDIKAENILNSENNDDRNITINRDCKFHSDAFVTNVKNEHDTQMDISESPQTKTSGACFKKDIEQNSSYRFYGCFTPYGAKCRPDIYGFRGPMHIWSEEEKSFTLVYNDRVTMTNCRARQIPIRKGDIHQAYIPKTFCKHFLL